MRYLLALLPLLALAQPVPSAKPYAGLWTEVDNLDEAVEANTDARAGELVSWYRLFHSPYFTGSRVGDLTIANRDGKGAATTLGEKLSAKGAMVSNYRNGSYTMTNAEAAEVESKIPLAIATWWPGHKSPSTGGDSDAAARITVDIGRTEPAIQVSSASRYKPDQAPETWPYLSSRGKGAAAGKANSSNTHDFVAWVRVDDEVMRVMSVGLAGPTITLKVDRGYFGTTAVPHAKGARVMAPVYIGSVGTGSPDARFAGSPVVDNPGKNLRYAMKVWRPDFIAWLANSMKAVFGNGQPPPYLQGINAGFLDITSCVTYNQADSYGQAVSAWDDPAGTVLTPAALGAHQIEKVRGLKKQFGESSGYAPMKWIANNVGANERNAACQNMLLGSGDYDGGMLENWLATPAMWASGMAQHFAVQKNNWPGVYFIKWGRAGAGAAQAKRFTYAAYLLGYTPSATRPLYGGTFGLKKPDELYFWDWGKPLSSASGIEDVAKMPCGVYRREFEKGLVLVNPSDQPANCQLSGAFYDVIKKTETRSVQVNPRDAAFLVKEN